MEQYVGKFHFWLKLCEIPLVVQDPNVCLPPSWRKTYIRILHHTTSSNPSPSILIAKSEYMALTSNDFWELLLLIHWNLGEISYWYLPEHRSRKSDKRVQKQFLINFFYFTLRFWLFLKYVHPDLQNWGVSANLKPYIKNIGLGIARRFIFENGSDFLGSTSIRYQIIFVLLLITQYINF